MPRPVPAFVGRITADGTSGYRAEPGRYHLHVGRADARSHRLVIQHALNGLDDVVALSYDDDDADRQRLAEAYRVSGSTGTGPALTDGETGRIVSTDARAIGVDLATEFGAWATGPDTYPRELRTRIEDLDAWLGPAVTDGVELAAQDFTALAELLDAFEGLEDLLAERRYLVGDTLTDADVRLWVSVVRFDARIHLMRRPLLRLEQFPAIWNYARALYRLPAFTRSTDLGLVLPPGAARGAWTAPPA